MADRRRKHHAQRAPVNPVLLTVHQAADYIGHSVWFVRNTLRYEVPYFQHVKDVSPVYFRRDVLDAWLEAHVHEPEAS